MISGPLSSPLKSRRWRLTRIASNHQRYHLYFLLPSRLTLLTLLTILTLLPLLPLITLRTLLILPGYPVRARVQRFPDKGHGELYRSARVRPRIVRFLTPSPCDGVVMAL
jgi:hypothetical protein